MNFGEIINITRNRIDELEEGDTQIDTIIKSAINHAYMHDLNKLEPNVSKAYLPSIDCIATLPEDINKIIKITPPLEIGEHREGNAIITNSDKTLTVIYTTVPTPLVSNNDIPEIQEKFHYMLSTYACYSYFNYRKKTNVAQQFLNEYMVQKNSHVKDNTGIEVMNDYRGW